MDEKDTRPVFNGVNGTTGEYLTAWNVSDLASRVDGAPKPENFEDLRDRKSRAEETYRAIAGVDPKKLSEAGWGIIFPDNISPEIETALKRLMKRRQDQAGELYRVFRGETGYNTQEPESKEDFLKNRDAPSEGPADPEKMPYYLLIVGSPDQIPYEFQHQLDVQYATGRIDFETPEEYENYANSVVEAEEQKLRRKPNVHLFGVTNDDDPATAASTKFLIEPLREDLQKRYVRKNWQLDVTKGEGAKKDALRTLLGGAQTPALLFTASHGMAFDLKDDRQRADQGALLCGDWLGPNAWGKKPISKDLYFSGTDVAADANLWGMIAFFFACYGGGTPHLDDFELQAGKTEQAVIAPKGFSAYLPQRMLAHPNGGALAVIAHVERAWGYSFLAVDSAENTIAQTAAYQSVVRQLLDGYPIGEALEYLNVQYAEAATSVAALIQKRRRGGTVPDWQLVSKWTAHNDARNFIIFGDPAVCIAANPEESQLSSQLAVELKPAPPPPSFAEPPPIPAPPLTPDSPSTAATLQAQSFMPWDRKKPNEEESGLIETLQNIAQNMADTLKNAINEAAELRIQTYVSEPGVPISIDGETPTQLRAATKIKLDGDTIVYVPRDEDGEIDTALWQIHLEMVKQAQAHREETIRIGVEAVASLLKVLRGG